MRKILLIIALSFCGYAFAESQPIQKDVPSISKKPERPDKSQNNSNAEQPISIQPASTVNITMSGKLNAESKQNNPEKNEEPIKWSEWLVAIFTGLLVIVTGYLVCYTRGLLIEARKQFPHFRANVAAATRAANAAQKSVQTMESTASKELRAYVGQESVVIRAIPNGKNIEIVIKNFGKTIAKDVVIDILVSTPHVINAGGNNSGVQSIGEAVIKPNIGVLMPSGTWPINVEFNRTDEISIFITGRIDYKDVFDNPQWTTFKCSKGQMNGAGRWHTETTQDGNDAT